MAELDFNTLSIPQGIKDALKTLILKYHINKFDPKGGAGYTFFGRNRVLGTDVAIKFYYWGGDPKFHAEPQALTKIQSPNVLSVHDAGYADGDYAYFVTPYCSGGDLDDLLAGSALGTGQAIDLTGQLLAGLGHLHQARFVHRDIKPLNIFLEDGPIAVIGDFGSLKRIPNGSDVIPASSLSTLYCPPESVGTGSYDFKGDIYQSGIVFYQLLGGYFPYDEVAWLSKNEKTAYDAMASGIDRAIHAKECINKKITAGKIIDYTTIPFWMPKTLKDIVKKA
jgi:serine/threonine protein kinase